jgi:hypothetical protein
MAKPGKHVGTAVVHRLGDLLGVGPLIELSFSVLAGRGKRLPSIGQRSRSPD